MLGWRGRIGLIIPSNNSVIEPELAAAAPSGVTVHGARIRVGSVFTPQGLAEMADQSDRAAQELQDSQADVLVYACMSTSLANGVAWEEQFVKRLGAKVLLFTAARATLGALRALGVRRCALLSPYPPALRPYVAPYFQAQGVTVTAERHLDFGEGYPQAVCAHPQERLYREARQLDLRGADGLCLLATDLATLGIVGTLEQDLQCPVVSTNQAILWQALRTLGVAEPIPEVGRLLRLE